MPARSPTGPLFLWLALQLLALWTAAAHVRLWANFPRPQEQFALDEMLVVQIAAAALLFPYLLRDGASALLAIIAAVPFVTLAAFLSAQLDPRNIIAATVAVAAWLAGLAVLNKIVQYYRVPLLGVAAAALLALAPPVLWYLRCQRLGDPELPWNRAAPCGPLMAALHLARHDPVSIPAWAFFALFLAVTVGAGGIVHRIARR